VAADTTTDRPDAYAYATWKNAMRMGTAITRSAGTLPTATTSAAATVAGATTTLAGAALVVTGNWPIALAVGGAIAVNRLNH